MARRTTHRPRKPVSGDMPNVLQTMETLYGKPRTRTINKASIYNIKSKIMKTKRKKIDLTKKVLVLENRLQRLELVEQCYYASIQLDILKRESASHEVLMEAYEKLVKFQGDFIKENEEFIAESEKLFCDIINTTNDMSMHEVAQELGLTESELIELAKDQGLINSDERATEFAITNGLLKEEIVIKCQNPTMN